jgi:hypothetical protein
VHTKTTYITLESIIIDPNDILKRIKIQKEPPNCVLFYFDPSLYGVSMIQCSVEENDV